MENPAIFVPYLIMAMNIVSVVGIVTYAAYCMFNKSCSASL